MNSSMFRATSGAMPVLAVISALLAPAAFAQTSGLVAAYSFDEGTGLTTADRSGNGNKGTLVNGVAWYSAGKYGNAVSFDGINDRIDVADSNSLDLRTGMTLEAWVRPTATGGYRTVVLKEVPGELAYSLYATDSDHGGRASGWIRQSGVSKYVDDTAALPLSVWSHIAVTYDGTNLRMYDNGILVRTKSLPGSIDVSSLPMRIGGNAIWGEFFKGQIDEVRVYNRPLAVAEIQTDMGTPITSSSGGGVTDTTPPQVSINSPVNGAVVSGTVSINAVASDNAAVAGVQFRISNANLGSEDTAAPYATTWNTTGLTNGNYAISAVARDTSQNVATSMPVSVTVSNAVTDTTAPSVSITAPSRFATVSGSTTVSAMASDDVGVAGVQFKADGINLGSEVPGPSFYVTWNTTTVSNGSHTLSAVARDAAGHTATATRTVTVSNVAPPAGTPLTIDGSRKFQTIDGMGVNANAASWNNGQLKPAIDMLVDQNGSTIWRLVEEMEDWEAQNDNNDPQVFNWTYYDAIYSSPRMEELWSSIAYLNQKGVTNRLMLSLMGSGPAWMGGRSLPVAMEDEWVETVASLVYYGRVKRGLSFGLLSPNNEPDLPEGLEGVTMDRYQYARVFKKLVVKLNAIGITDLKLVGPDTAVVSGGVNDYMPELMKDATSMSKLEHFGLHDYSGSTGGADAAIKRSAYPNLNFWMTELSLVGDMFSVIGQNAAAVIMWDGYDSVYQHAIVAGRGSVAPNDGGNGPSLLAYNSSTGVYTPRKEFYQFAQVFKYVLPGAVRVGTTYSSSGITMYAFVHPVTGRVTLIGRNTGSSNVTFSGSLQNVATTVPAFEFYYTNASNNMLRTTDVPVTNGAFSFTAPASSVFTLTFAGTTN